MAASELKQGEIYWVDDEEPFGSEPGNRRPWLIVQNNVVNASRINSVLACPLTSSLGHARAVGNVSLAKREAGLSVASVVQVLGISALDRRELGEYIGKISGARMAEVIEGLFSVLEPRDP